MTLALAAGLAVSAAAANGMAAEQGATGHAPLRMTGNSALPPAATEPSAAATAQRLPRSTTVTLPTGDQVRLTGAGALQQATPIPAGSVTGTPSAPATFVRFTWNGDQYVVPDPAVPYLHFTLDPRLFDVSYLVRAHLATQGSAGIPVHITYTSPGQTASVPGLHVTRRTSAAANGTITAARAIRLGRLLADQWHAARSHHSPVPVGRLPGVKSITLARPAGAPPLPARPGRIPARADAAASRLPYYTLTLNFTDQGGHPATFAGFTQNLGNAALGTSFTSGSGGSERLSVPKGSYSLVFSVLTPDASGTGFDTALVVKPQVTVNSDTTMVMDARTAVPYRATSPGVSAPAQEDSLGFWRTTRAGDCSASGFVGVCGTFSSGLMYLYSAAPNYCPSFCADKLSATPTAPVSEGSVFFDATTHLYSGQNGSAQSQYVFDFPHPGSIPSSLTYTVPAAGMTAVHSDLYQTPLASGCTGLLAASTVYFPVGNGAWSSQGFQASAVAGKRTDYWYSSDPAQDLWQYTAGYNYGSCPLNPVSLNGPVESIQHGRQVTATWNRAPLAPPSLAPPYYGANYLSPAANDDINFLGKKLGDPRRLTVCTACRQGAVGTINVLPYGDSGPAQYDNFLYTGEDSGFSFYRNGTLAIDTEGFGVRSLPLGWELPLLSRPASYRLDWTESQRNGDAPPGASIDTDWTFRSGPADPVASLPPTETCAPDASRSCSYLPLLFPSYDLPLNDSNQATAGTPEKINFTVTGQQHAPAPAGLSATVAASFDGGTTWTTPQAATGLGHGRFTATISQPALSATNGWVSLRVTATDDSGDSVTQTITDAYGLTS